MNKEEQEQFRREFASIVYLNSCIISSGVWLKQLHAWDKNDSHKEAIIKSLDERKELKIRLEAKLKGKSYDEWKTFSKKTHYIKRKSTQGDCPARKITGGNR